MKLTFRNVFEAVFKHDIWKTESEILLNRVFLLLESPRVGILI